MKRAAWVLAVVVAAGVVAAGFWWSQKRTRPYEGLAQRFPAKAEVYVEVRELGQWMDLKGEKGSGATSTADRGVDPMMQVLGQVWAAQPVRPQELPELLRHQRAALGLWREKGSFKGVGAMALEPGQAKPIEDFLKSKLGEGQVVATVAGVPLRMSDKFGEEDLKDALWGVSSSWAVVATGLDEAKCFLEPSGEPLSKEPFFQTTLKKIPHEKGAFLVVKGDFLAQLAKEKMAGKKAAQISGAPETPKEEPQAKQEEQGAAKPKSEPTPGAKPPECEERSGAMTLAHGLAGVASESLGKALSLESIQALGVWTNPPEGEQKGWAMKAWLGFNEPAKGLWRMVAEGSPTRPNLLNRLPKDAKLYVWGGGKDLARIYQITLDEMQKDLPADKAGWVRAGIGAAEGKLGLSFANDLLPALGDEWCYVGETAEGKEGLKRGAFFLTLRDSRRFEDLVTKNLAVQLHLKVEQLQGAKAWSWSGDLEAAKQLRLVVSGGVAILTNDPSWALSTGGSAGKAYQRLAQYREKASGLCVIDPSVWAKANDVLTQVVWRSGPSGLEMDARFPGEPPGFCGKGGKCKELATGSSPEERRDPEASGSL